MIIDNYAIVMKELGTKLMLSQKEMSQFLGVSFSSNKRYENSIHERTSNINRKLLLLLNEYDTKLKLKLCKKIFIMIKYLLKTKKRLVADVLLSFKNKFSNIILLKKQCSHYLSLRKI